MKRISALVAAAAALGVTATSASAAPTPALGSLTSSLSGNQNQVEAQLGQILDTLPGFPALSTLPGANLVPDITAFPGLPQIQGLTNKDQNTVTDPAVGGSFTAPFAEPGANCPNETNGSPTPTNVTKAYINCKPAGVSVAVLPNSSQVLYFDGLEGEEQVKYSIVAEFAKLAVNDQSRLLNLNFANPSSSIWTPPTNSDGGANGASDTQYLLPHMPGILGQIFNDQGQGSGALFCSALSFLSNGELLVPGGTDYYLEPRLPGTGLGVSELQGLRNTRIFNPATGAWSEAGKMNYGRWYPSLVTMANGKVFVASGVTKLLKPIYTGKDLLNSGTNVEQTETFDPTTGKWTANPATASHSLPLYPRLHLLPDGHIYYDGGGQTFNPFGQSYDEALWNLTASFDPASQKWSYLGVPFGISVDQKRPLDTSLSAGFRGSAASVMLPLKPPYSQASFLDAGGVLGTSPGAYLANTSSIVNTVSIDSSGEHFSSKPTPPLNNARWYSSTVLLPTGQAIAFNGANRDEVVLPGTSFPVTEAELFDPATNAWTPLASSHVPRTYHNTAVLLPSGQVLIGGNAPIDNGYLYSQTLPGGFSNNFRDPSFQVYNPPYLEWGIAQPTISSIGGLGAGADVGYASTLTIHTPDAGQIASVVLARNTAQTHVVDGDQRSVELKVLSTDPSAGTVTVAAPPTGNVAPPGPYLLFVNKTTPKGLIPSVAKQVFVGPQGGPVPTVAP